MASPNPAPSSLAERSAAALRDNDAAARFLGVEIDAVTPGRARARMTVTSEMLNGHGMAHGGLVFALADAASYALILAARRDEAAVTVDLTINFLRPAMTLPVAVATTLRAGRRLFTAEVGSPRTSPAG